MVCPEILVRPGNECSPASFCVYLYSGNGNDRFPHGSSGTVREEQLNIQGGSKVSNATFLLRTHSLKTLLSVLTLPEDLFIILPFAYPLHRIRSSDMSKWSFMHECSTEITDVSGYSVTKSPAEFHSHDRVDCY